MSLRRTPLPVLSRGTVNRVGERRLDTDWLAQVWAIPATRVLRLYRGRTPVAGAPPALDFVGPGDVPADAERYLLGVEDEVAFFAVVLSRPPVQEAASDGTVTSAADGGVTWAGLREVGALLGDRDAGLFTHAVALAHWHRSHLHCPSCGTPTDIIAAGAVRRCPVEGSEHHPRTDPAVIMLVTDDADRALLGHHIGWPEGRFSTLAGFVEPGESLEAAVAREVAEEVGVTVVDPHYVASQPWPFPSSLMLGFVARAVSTEVRVDHTEITQARWFTRERLAAEVVEGSVLLPPAVSIARRLIEGWFGAGLPDAPRVW